jgi:glutathione S-transferase
MARLTLVLGNKAYSSWSLRPWLALKHTGVRFDEIVIPLDQPETKARILAHSPGGRVPCLIDGDLNIPESLAICEYAAELDPAAGLWPQDRLARALARAAAAEMHAGFAKLRQHLPMDLKRAPGPRALTPEVEAEVRRIIEIWTECRRRYGAGGAFLFGRFGNADAMFAPVVTRFATYAVPLDAEAAAYRDAVLALPAMRDWTAAAKAEPWSVRDSLP